MSPLAVDSSSSRPRSPSSPSTPIRIDRPPLKAPSPLSTASSPYQFIDESDALPSPVDSHVTSSKPSRRKSILGKRRNFTQVWNGYSSTTSLNTTITSPGDNTSRDVNTRQAGAFSNNNDNKKKGNKNHQNSTSSTETRHDNLNSEDYPSSSLLAASKRVFSKSVDDLSSFTKTSLLSSPINYSRPRKSVDERRITQIYHRPFSASPTSSNNATYGFSNMQSGFIHKRPNNGTDPAEEEELDDISTGSSTSLAHSPMPSDDSLSSSIPPSFPRNHHPTHHIFKVPKLPSLPSSKHSVSSSTSSTASTSASVSATAPPSLQKGKKEHKQKSASKHRKASSSFAQQSVQLPPSISLPGGLCIESTASILASSMEEDIPANPSSFLDFSNEIMSSVPQGSSEGRNGIEITNNIENQRKRKSMDGRSVKSDTILLTSPGLAPPFKLSPTLSSKSAPSPTLNPSPSNPSSFPLSSSPSGTSSFPKRPPLASRKSSGNARTGSTKSNATARFPSFGSPKSSPLALNGQSDNNPNNTSSAVGSRPVMPGRQRSSQIILIEGFLQRKTDHRSHIKASSWSFPFSSSSGGSIFSSSSSNTASSASATPGKSGEPQFNSLRRPSPGRSNSEANVREVDLSKGWKPFYAILRGTNLYLYKLSSDLSWQAKTCFSNYITTRSLPSTTSLSSSSTRMPSTFAPSTPCQTTSSLNEDKVKASISNSAKAAYLLPIANSTVRLVHSATRGDVFELVTEEGEVAILQTGDKAETDKWMQILSNTGTSIANKRASYLETIGKLDIGNALAEKRLQPDTIQERKSESHDRPMPGQASSVQQNNARMFGTSLEELVRREGGKIPRLAEALFKEIESRGLLEVSHFLIALSPCLHCLLIDRPHQTGIYRVPGENRVMQATKAKLNGERMHSFGCPCSTFPQLTTPFRVRSHSRRRSRFCNRSMVFGPS